MGTKSRNKGAGYERKVYIYALIDPITKEIRYVGCSLNADNRYKAHLHEASHNHKCHKCNWIRKLVREGNSPVLNIIDEVPEEDWQLAECAWIFHYREELECKLTNMTDGGDGILNPSIITRIRLSKSRIGSKNHRYGKSLSEDTKELIRIHQPDRSGKNHRYYGKFGTDHPAYGYEHTAEAKSHISLCMQEWHKKHPEHVKGVNNPMYGKPSAMKGKKHTEESKKLMKANSKDKHGSNNSVFGKIKCKQCGKFMYEDEALHYHVCNLEE